jgi:hypothetical protein
VGRRIGGAGAGAAAASEARPAVLLSPLSTRRSGSRASHPHHLTSVLVDVDGKADDKEPQQQKNRPRGGGRQCQRQGLHTPTARRIITVAVVAMLRAPLDQPKK